MYDGDRQPIRVLCSEVIADTTHRGAVAEKLRATGHEVIDNIEGANASVRRQSVGTRSGAWNVIALSTTAWRSF